jgi:hypothetical protein
MPEIESKEILRMAEDITDVFEAAELRFRREYEVPFRAALIAAISVAVKRALARRAILGRRGDWVRFRLSQSIGGGLLGEGLSLVGDAVFVRLRFSDPDARTELASPDIPLAFLRTVAKHIPQMHLKNGRPFWA